MSSIYPPATPEIARRRRDLAPNQQAALEALGKAVFADGALPTKTKQIIAVAVAHVTQCPYCINGHTKAAVRAGATPEELMEAIWVAAEMRAGAAYAHSTLMLATLSGEGETSEWFRSISGHWSTPFEWISGRRRGALANIFRERA